MMATMDRLDKQEKKGYDMPLWLRSQTEALLIVLSCWTLFLILSLFSTALVYFIYSLGKGIIWQRLPPYIKSHAYIFYSLE